MRWAIFVVISALMFGCSSKLPSAAEKKHPEKAPEKVISRDEAYGSLPCFKCHSYQKFSGQPRKGIFSHQIHTKTGYHCNQCHDFKGHRHITINKNVCGNCHGIRVIAFNKTSMPSRFNHESHTRKTGCRECHPKVFVMKSGSSQVTMKDIDNGLFCGACHNGKKAFPSSDCSKCHDLKKFDKELTYQTSFGAVAFSHKFHTAAFSCGDCHTKLFKMKKTQGKMKMDDINAGKYCGACHNGNVASPATECMKCHKT